MQLFKTLVVVFLAGSALMLIYAIISPVIQMHRENSQSASGGFSAPTESVVKDPEKMKYLKPTR